MGSFRRTFGALDYGEDEDKLIEIFYVLIKTKNRLIIRDVKTKQDIHSQLEYINLAESVLNQANYLHRMQKQDNPHEEDDEEDAEDRPVYDLSSVQQRMYDTRHEEFFQQHMFRFEIDRTRKIRIKDEDTGAERVIRNPNQNVIKITDIDCYLDGNRHLILKA